MRPKAAIAYRTSTESQEFTREQNAVFSKLARAMTFVAIGKATMGAGMAIAAATMRLSLVGVGLCSVVAIAFIAMGIFQYGAAGHFRRIVSTKGHDTDDLMAAMIELTATYSLQRWLWIVLAATVVTALLATAVGWS